MTERPPVDPNPYYDHPDAPPWLREYPPANDGLREAEWAASAKVAEADAAHAGEPTPRVPNEGDYWRGQRDALRSILDGERPPVDPLREAARAVISALDAIHDDVTETDYALALIDLRAALASPAVPETTCADCGKAAVVDADMGVCRECYDRLASPAAPPEGLDVERLAQAMDAVFAAGSDFELQHVGKPHPVLAGRIAREYARLSDTGDTDR